MGWLTGWGVRKKHTLTGSVAGAQSDYQLRFEVHYGAGVDAGAVVYCDSQCKVDFGDIRFTKADGTTHLDYWIQQQVNSDVAYIWVEVDSIPASPDTVDIYLYYGNAAAATTSSFADAWLETDDYSADPIISKSTVGNYLLSTWDVADRALAGHRFDFDVYIYDHDWFSFGCTPRVGMYWSTSGAGFGNTNGVLMPDDTDIVEGNFYQNYYASGAPVYTNTGVAWVDDTWYVYSLKFDAKYKLSIWRKSTAAFVVADDDEDYDAQTITHMGVGWNGGSGAPGTVTYDAVNDWIDAKPTRTPGWVYFYIDNFRVGTYCDPEPAHTSWGLVETFRDLPAQFEVGQGSAELLGRFKVGQDSAELLGNAVIRQSDSAELLGEFEAQATAELLGNAIIRNIGSADLLGEFEAQVTAELLSNAVIRNIGSAELLGNAVIRDIGSADLLGEFEAQVTAELLGKFVVRHSGPVPWLTGWRYRKTHTLTGSTAGGQTNYQVGVKAYYGAGADGTEIIGGVTFGKVYCNSKCKTDFSDIRFTNWGGITLLDYWLQEKVDSDYAIFWVEVDSIPASPSTVDIYIYYGNASATYTDAQQHGKDTFIAFDDFPGVALDGQWTTDANISVTVAGGTLTCKATASSWSTWHGIHMALANVQGIRLESYTANWGHVASDLFQFGSMLGVDWTNQALGHRLSDSHVQTAECYLTYIHDNSGLSKGDIDGQEPVDLVEQRDQNGAVKFFKDGVEQQVGGETSTDAFDTLMILCNRFTDDVCPNLYLDRLLARSYVDPEPAHTAWGPETEVALLAEFIVRQSGSAELLGKADINPTIQSGSADLLGKLEAQAIADLLGRFEAQATANLLGKFDVGQGSQDLLCKFEAQATADLLGKFETQATAELLGRFDAQAIVELLGRAEITHSVDLLAKFEAQATVELLGKFDAQATADLLGRADITHSVDLLGKASITHSVDLLGKFEAQATARLLGKFVAQATADLLGRFEAQATAELLGNAEIQQSDFADLLGKFETQATTELLGKFESQVIAELLGEFEVGQDSADLFSHFEVGQDSVYLLGRAAIRHSASSDLKFSLYVSPWYLTAAEMLIGGRDRRMDMGGLDREMVIGGRKRRMKIK